MANEQEHDDVVAEVVETSTALEAVTSGEIRTMTDMAQARPRNIKRFVTEARDLASLDEETASACFYSLPRGGKSIEGPSVRLAEIVASAWGHCRYGARVISEDDRFVTAQGYFLDVQRNVAVSFEVRRRITDKRGQKFNDDMVGVTSNAACSIALRNAVFRGIPRAFWESAYVAARQAAVGDIKTLATRRADLIGYFGKMGVVPDQIVGMLGVPSVEMISSDHLVTLKGLATALKDGETTIEQAFAPVSAPALKAVANLDAVLASKPKIETEKAKPKSTKCPSCGGSGCDVCQGSGEVLP